MLAILWLVLLVAANSDLTRGVEREATYTIVVHSVSGEPLESVSIILVTDQETVLGTTDRVGIVTLKSTSIGNLDAGAVLACRGGYYCGGWPLSEQYFTREDQWLSIDLAPIRIR